MGLVSDFMFDKFKQRFPHVKTKTNINERAHLSGNYQIHVSNLEKFLGKKMQKQVQVGPRPGDNKNVLINIRRKIAG